MPRRLVDRGTPRYVEVPEGVSYLEKGTQFWQARVDGTTVVFTSGVIGTPGTTTKHKTKGDWNARVEIQRALHAKLREGYAYVLHGKPPARVGRAAVNPTLEAQLSKEVTDEALAVYADWLQEQGDIRGELAALQAGDRKLAKAAEALLWEQRAYFYGPLAPFVTPRDRRDRPVVARWRAGWLDALTLGACAASGPGDVAVDDAAALVRLVPRVASARFLRHLAIARPQADSELDFTRSVSAVISVLPKLPALRWLTLGALDAADGELSRSHLGSLARLWKVAARLESVKLRAGSMQLGKIALPAAREFRVETGGLDRAAMKAIATAHWPNLETLDVWLGDEAYGCTVTLPDLRPILDGKGLAKLRHLGLENSQFGDRIAVALAESKILPQLATLDLSMSHITTEVLVRDLLPRKAAFAKLAHLDLSRCLLDARGQKLAKQLCARVSVDGQRNPADYTDHRYAAVGE